MSLAIKKKIKKVPQEKITRNKKEEEQKVAIIIQNTENQSAYNGTSDQAEAHYQRSPTLPSIRICD